MDVSSENPIITKILCKYILQNEFVAQLKLLTEL